MNAATTFNCPSNLMQSKQIILVHANQRRHQPAACHENPMNHQGRHSPQLFNHHHNLAESRIPEGAHLLANLVMEAGAATKTTVARAWLVMLLLAVGLAGHAAGQACTSTFFSALLQLMPCRPAVTPFSPAPPSEACCNAVKTLGQPCLCELVNGPPITGVDRNMATQLPGKCTVDFQPCNGVRRYSFDDKLAGSGKPPY